MNNLNFIMIFSNSNFKDILIFLLREQLFKI
jgi:hypothetical protein